MIAPLETRIDKAEKPDSSNNVISSPEVDPKTGKPTQRAITSATQAHAIAKSLRDRAKEGRIKTAAVIADKYNGSAPFLESDLARVKQTWRNNFSTNFLASIIDRVKPQLLDPVNKADILTHSSLPPTVENSASKSRTFCEVTTRVIRRWPQWKDFTSQLAQENVLFGLATPGWIDHDWRPRLWKFDEAYFPEGTGQHASKVQVCVFAQKMLIHEFMQLFADPEIADKAGYNVENCATAANNAHARRSKSGDPTDLERQDAKREGNEFADSYDGQTKTVDLFHVLVHDYSGEVDLWTVTQDEGLEIRNVEKLHDSMEDGTTLFTFQSGNGKLYGSKGLGRLLTNLHIAIERGRCLGADQMYLSGLVIFKTKAKDAASLQAKVRHPFIFVQEDAEVVTQQIQFSVEAFEVMDAKLSRIADSIAGAFIPPNLDQSGSPNTKIEAAQRAERELAVKEGVLGRFFDHLADLISAMQRKIYSPINLREGKRAFEQKQEKTQKGIRVLMRKVWKLLTEAFGAKNEIEPEVDGNVGDEEAVAAIVELMEAGLTVEDIAMLALAPSAQTSENEGADRDNRTLQFIANNKQNPFINQKEATKMEARITMGEDRADMLVVPEEDPNVEAIAMRDQLQEFLAMMAGIPQPVAASDNHDIHRKVVSSKLAELMPAVEQAPTTQLVATAELLISHYADHLENDTQTPEPQKKQEAEGIRGMWKIVQQQKAALAKAAEEAAAAGVQAGPDGLPVPVEGQPPQVGANGVVDGEDPEHRKALELGDQRLRAYEIGQRDRELSLKEQAQSHQIAKDAAAIQQTNMQIVQKQAQQTSQQEQEAARLELQQQTANAQQKI